MPGAGADRRDSDEVQERRTSSGHESWCSLGRFGLSVVFSAIPYDRVCFLDSRVLGVKVKGLAILPEATGLFAAIVLRVHA